MASLCQSLQCLISALTQAGGGGLLFRFACSVALWGGRGTAGRYPCVWVALTVFQPHWVCPRSWVCDVLVYTVQAPGCSIWSGPCIACGSSFRVFHKSTDFGSACILCLPRQEQLRLPGADGRTFPGCSAPSPLCGPSLSFRAGQSGACTLCLFLGAGL